MVSKSGGELRSPDVIQRCADWLIERALPSGTTLLGVSGAQGSGKTTLTRSLADLLEHSGLAVATLSLDDFYLPRAERERLARDEHPLWATRGVPGTHEVSRLRDVLMDLRSGRGAVVPVFDKARDDRLPREAWRKLPSIEYRFVLFEGWCLGITPEADDELRVPVNDLEARDDADGRWRNRVNGELAGDYRELFAELDLLLVLLAPSFDIVYRWRAEQEHELERSAKAAGTMDRDELERFIMHFERLTRRSLSVLPARADAVLELDQERRVQRWILR